MATPWVYKSPKRLGELHKRAYYTWAGMIQRCTNPNHAGYKSYGGRGINVCESWLKFENFLIDMGDPPVGFSIERVNVDGPYCKDNCKWASRREQSLNTSRNLMLEHGGITKTAHEWAEQIGMKPKTFRRRIYLGWTTKQAIETPIGAKPCA